MNLLKSQVNTIRGRFFLGYALVIVLVLIFIVNSFLQLNQVRQLSAQISPISRQQEILQQYTVTLAAFDAEIEQFSVVGSSQNVEAVQNNITELQAIADMLLTETERTSSMLQQFVELNAELAQQVDQLLTIRQAGDDTRQINQQTIALFDTVRQVRAQHQALILDVSQQLQDTAQQQDQRIANLLPLYLLLGGLILAIFVGNVFFVNRGVVNPIINLTNTVREIERGDLSKQVPLTNLRELDQLASTFNAMTGQLRTTLDGLEYRVADRTQQLELMAVISERFTAILQQDTLLEEIVKQIKENFGYSYVHIYLLDPNREYLTVTAGIGEPNETLLSTGWRIAYDAPKSLVAKAARTGQIVWVDDVHQDPTWLSHDLLPNTGSEMAVPIIQASKVVGVLNVQSDKVGSLSDGDAYVLRSLANQIGVALNNARLYEDLTKLNEDKDRFFSIVAHDLKGPFQPVLGNSELLRDELDNLMQQDIEYIAASIHRSAQQVFQLLEGLLQWARMQMGRMEFQPRQLDLAPIAEQTVDLLFEAAEVKRIKLRNLIIEEQPIYADENMVNTILRNLINNALKFTRSGGTVTLSAEAEAAFVTVSVADSGVGIRDEVQTKLFQIGVHHSTAGTANETGTGLGLIICQEMVQLNGGQIWVESEVGQGSIFRFTLPTKAAMVSDA